MKKSLANGDRNILRIKLFDRFKMYFKIAWSLCSWWFFSKFRQNHASSIVVCFTCTISDKGFKFFYLLKYLVFGYLLCSKSNIKSVCLGVCWSVAKYNIVMLYPKSYKQSIDNIDIPILQTLFYYIFLIKSGIGNMVY